jgi:hypothetical protein
MEMYARSCRAVKVSIRGSVTSICFYFFPWSVSIVILRPLSCSCGHPESTEVLLV